MSRPVFALQVFLLVLGAGLWLADSSDSANTYFAASMVVGAMNWLHARDRQ